MPGRWITDMPPERDGRLDILDSGRYHSPEPEGTDVPKRETYVKPTPPFPAPADSFAPIWAAVGFLVGILAFAAVGAVTGAFKAVGWL